MTRHIDFCIFEKFEFGKGDPGFEVDGFMVSTTYYGTQATELGVDVGWSVCEVNGQYMTSDEIQEVVTSGEPFSITFQTQPLKEREQLFFRSTISSKVNLCFKCF